MTHSSVQNDTFMCVTPLIHTRDNKMGLTKPSTRIQMWNMEKKKKGDLRSPQEAFKCETWEKEKKGTYKALKKHSNVKHEKYKEKGDLHSLQEAFKCETWEEKKGGLMKPSTRTQMWNMGEKKGGDLQSPQEAFKCETWEI